MDLGVAGGGLDGLEEGSVSGFGNLSSSDPETRHKLYGSGYFVKQEEIKDDWRSLKMARSVGGDEISGSSKGMLLQQRGNGLVMRSSNTSSAALFSDTQKQQQMLCFSSSPKSEAMLMERSSQSAALPYIYYASSSASYDRNTGYNSGSLNGASSIVTGVRGPFTPSQWLELEHQALIYKYITSNMSIPSNLLNSIKRALDSAGFSPFSGRSLAPTTLGWGSFHLGFSSSTDPEPWRCRRTDGKKWRCSRDAVADQKYCERHMNRGRHRSRKPVEVQAGHSATRNSTTTTTRLMPVATSAPAVVVAASGGASNSLANVQRQVKNLQQCGTSNSSAATHLNRNFLKKENTGGRIEERAWLSMLSPTINLKSKEAPPVLKQQASYEESSQTEFGLVSSDSLLNPFHKSSSFMTCQTFNTSQDLSDREPDPPHSLRPFIDNWPKIQTDRSVIPWPDTQLSISTPPLTSSSFMSASSSSPPPSSKVTLSPLRLSCEINPIQMGLGVGNVNEATTTNRQADLIPMSWGISVGGPLGEVLHSTNNNSSVGGDCMNSSALHLMTMDGWDGGSPNLGSSPTGVLQKTTFGSLSNSSTGSSPRPENNSKMIHEGAASLCNDLLGTNLLHSSSSLPLL